MKTLYISQSAIRDWLVCHRRYYYRLNFKKQSKPTKAMLLGEIVHYILEKYSDNQAMALQEAFRAETNYELTERDTDVLVDSIGGFFDNFTHLVTPDDTKEEMFTVPYSRDVFLTGKFDRITPSHLVIDWKTGKHRSNNLETDAQAIIYFTAYKYLYGVEPSVAVAYLRSNKLVTYNRNELYESTLLNEILPYMVEDIRRGEFPRTGYFTGSCYNCSFKEFCDLESGL